VVLRAGFAVRLAVALVPLVLRVDFAAVLRAAGRVLDLVLGRPAELLTALVLVDLVLREAAGLRRAVARDVVCTGTAFPPVLINYGSAIPQVTASYTLHSRGIEEH
jgi:hypothetical protein